MTGLIPLYLRKEPTTDSVVLKYAPEARLFDVVAYRSDPLADPGAPPVARWRWDFSKPDRRNRRVMLNCFAWRAVWLADLEAAQ